MLFTLSLWLVASGCFASMRQFFKWDDVPRERRAWLATAIASAWVFTPLWAAVVVGMMNPMVGNGLGGYWNAGVYWIAIVASVVTIGIVIARMVWRRRQRTLTFTFAAYSAVFLFGTAVIGYASYDHLAFVSRAETGTIDSHFVGEYTSDVRCRFPYLIFQLRDELSGPADYRCPVVLAMGQPFIGYVPFVPWTWYRDGSSAELGDLVRSINAGKIPDR